MSHSKRVRSGNDKGSRRWLALIVLAFAQFLVVLDASIVNIALPSLGAELEMNTNMLSWVITAYVLPFGGLLLLGGRLADRFGHRRIFITGVAGFVLTSAAAGFAESGAWLLAARAVQGASAALLAPAALALVTKLFTQPQDRAKALGIWGAVAGIGSAAGVLLGGVLTSSFGWPSVFFVNVPVGILVIAALPALVSKDEAAVKVKMDLPGAITVTGGIAALVAALSEAEHLGWSNPLTLMLALAAVILLVLFIMIEKRSADPLVPFRIFHNRSVTGGNLSMLLIGGATTGVFFALSVYMQQVLQYNALTAGLTQLPLAGALVVFAGIVPGMIKAIGTRWTLAYSLILLAVGLIGLSFAPSDASFAIHLLGPTMIIGIGLGGAFVSGTELAVHGVKGSEAGLASGLVNTSQQAGGAIGLAVLASIAAARTNGLLSKGSEELTALTGGFSWVFLGAALFSLLGALIVILVVRPLSSSKVIDQSISICERMNLQ
ncbi:MFS transporter [Paenibacillus harenae]|uniref:MFS transporter n=1 Tax=Paenibacillus harenae TaxID=306543 RepID=UPI00068622D4|nr:MFS transporter [Paenibacillus harenae]